MRNFFTYKYSNLYPLIAIVGGLTIVIFSLVYANDVRCSYFLIAAYLIMFLFINYKTCLKSLIYLTIIGGLFFLIAYLVSNRLDQGLSMINRVAAFTVGMIPGVSLGTDRLARNMSQIRAPRSLTIGMLIVFSFMPTLLNKSRRVKEGMKARGSFTVLNPKILYRAFLIPFITRIVDISDTLSLSIETRGFDLHNKNYSLYKKEYIRFSDILFLLLIVLGIILVIIL